MNGWLTKISIGIPAVMVEPALHKLPKKMVIPIKKYGSFGKNVFENNQGKPRRAPRLKLIWVLMIPTGGNANVRQPKQSFDCRPLPYIVTFPAMANPLKKITKH